MGGTNARPLLIMTCANKVTPGGSHAHWSIYPHPPHRPPLRRTGLPTACPPDRPRPQVQSPCPVGAAVLGRLPHQLVGRCLPHLARRAVGHGDARRLVGYPARPRRTATPPLPGLAER